MSDPALLAVVVPARDEALLLPGCLAALSLASQHPEIVTLPVLVVVVADSCTDATAEIARAAGAHVVVTDAGNVGAARRAGMTAALEQAAARGTPEGRVWLACTDADSRPPADWLALQQAGAQSGVDAVVGTVRVTDWSAHPAHVPIRFQHAYDAWLAEGAAGHPHVHGANLGVRGSAYLAVGGFPPLAVSEDVALVEALLAAGRAVLRTPASPVVTSARRVPRAAGGFGTDLDALATEPQAS